MVDVVVTVVVDVSPAVVEPLKPCAAITSESNRNGSAREVRAIPSGSTRKLCGMGVGRKMEKREVNLWWRWSQPQRRQ